MANKLMTKKEISKDTVRSFHHRTTPLYNQPLATINRSAWKVAALCRLANPSSSGITFSKTIRPDIRIKKVVQWKLEAIKMQL